MPLYVSVCLSLGAFNVFIIFNVFICLWGRLLNWFFFHQMWVNHNETLDTSITGETPTNIFKSL